MMFMLVFGAMGASQMVQVPPRGGPGEDVLRERLLFGAALVDIRLTPVPGTGSRATEVSQGPGRFSSKSVQPSRLVGEGGPDFKLDAATAPMIDYL